MSLILPLLMGRQAARLSPAKHSVHLAVEQNQYAVRTMVTPTDNKKCTLSMWIRRGIATVNGLFSSGDVGGDRIFFNGTSFNYYQGATAKFSSSSNWGDITAWHHLVFTMDSTTQQLRLYRNNVLVDSNSALTLNQAIHLNTAGVLQCLGLDNHADKVFDGNIADIHFIDGQIKAPSDFGLVNPDTSRWEPKKYIGSHGANGFHLDLADDSSVTAFGRDVSSNSNNWTWVNIVLTGVGKDQSFDSPSHFVDGEGDHGCFPIWDSQDPNVAGSASDGGMRYTPNSNRHLVATKALDNNPSGWYWEVTSNSGAIIVGIAPKPHSNLNGLDTPNFAYYGPGGTKYSNGTAKAFGATHTTGDIIGTAYRNGQIWWSKNGVWQGAGNPSAGLNPAFSGITGTKYPMLSSHGGVISATCNFGQRPFSFTPPTGFNRLSSLRA